MAQRDKYTYHYLSNDLVYIVIAGESTDDIDTFATLNSIITLLKSEGHKESEILVSVEVINDILSTVMDKI